jgi:hypothetical protein
VNDVVSCYTVFSDEHPIKTDRESIKQENKGKEGEKKRVGSIVHRVEVQTLHRRRKLTVPGGEKSDWASGRRTKARGIKKADESRR